MTHDQILVGCCIESAREQSCNGWIADTMVQLPPAGDSVLMAAPSLNWDLSRFWPGRSYGGTRAWTLIRTKRLLWLIASITRPIWWDTCGSEASSASSPALSGKLSGSFASIILG